MLASPAFLKGRDCPFAVDRCLPHPILGDPGIRKKLLMVWSIVRSRYILAWKILRHRPDLILLDSYVEYMAPLWVDPHIVLARIFGFRYAANLHDPVRNYVIGPMWWHRLSVWLAYQPLDFVLIHNKLPERSTVPKRVKAVEVPVGVYDICNSKKSRHQIRDEWGVKNGQMVFLAFGYVRDGKNLDLAIRALEKVPEAFLVIAGSVASSGDRPFSYYQDLSVSLKVDERCRLFEGFVSDEALGGYSIGTDFFLLTYSSNFHSQSGVLNIAAKARKPVLASASPGPMTESVKRFSLGLAIPPDNFNSIVEGMRGLIDEAPVPDWDNYEAVASWEANAKGILLALDSLMIKRDKSYKSY